MNRTNGGMYADGIEQLLAHYRIADVCVPPALSGREDTAAYINENTALILVPAVLHGAWYRSLTCPMLAWDTDGLRYALWPGKMGRAWYRGEDGKRRVYITEKNQARFVPQACAVYRELAGETPAPHALAARLLQGMGLWETAMLFFWCVLGGCLLALMGLLAETALADAVREAGLSAAGQYAAGAVLLAAAVAAMLYVGRRMTCRISRRAALGLLAPLGERLWFHSSFETSAESAAGLAALRESGETLCRWLLALLCGAGLFLPCAAGLARLSSGMAWTAAGTAVILGTAAAAKVRRAGRHSVPAQEERRDREAHAGGRHPGVEQAFLSGSRTAAGQIDWGALLWPPLPSALAWAVAGTAAAFGAAAAVRRRGRRQTPPPAQEEHQWLETRTGGKRFGVEQAFPFGRPTAFVRMDWVCLLLPLLLVPVLWLGVREGMEEARLARAVLLFLSAVLFPLCALGSAARTGEAAAEIWALLPQAKRSRGHERETPETGSVLELKNVTFTYPGCREPVLRNVSLWVAPGDVIGILGGTGAGKTTLAQLMTGRLRPDSGMVYYGGTELHRYEPESVQIRIAPENGTDIRLLNRTPAPLDGRTTIVFSTREKDMKGCSRVYTLSGGCLQGGAAPLTPATF